MTDYNLQWSKALLNDIQTQIYAQFFAIVSGDKILYIGKSFHANLGATLEACLREFHLDHHQTPDIYLGRLREYGRHYIPTEVLESLHQLMVFAKKPYLNENHKMCYNGLSDIKLNSTGLDLLPGKMRAQNRLVFLSKVPAKTALSFQPAIAG